MGILLWDGKDLRYVGEDTLHNDPSNTERYYFSMEYTTPSGTTVKKKSDYGN